MTAPGEFLTGSGSYLPRRHVGTDSQAETQELDPEISKGEIRCFIGETTVEVAKGATVVRGGYGEVSGFSEVGTERVSTGSCTHRVEKILEDLFSKAGAARVSAGSGGKVSKCSKIVLEYFSKEVTVRLPSGSYIQEVGKIVDISLSNAEAARVSAGSLGKTFTVSKIILKYLSKEGMGIIPSGSTCIMSGKPNLPSSPQLPSSSSEQRSCDAGGDATSARKRLRT